MKPSRLRRSRKTSRDGVMKPPGHARVTRAGKIAGRSAAAANTVAERERVVLAREAAVRRREQALAVKEKALRVQEAAAQMDADVERLMGQLREANERLIVASIEAQNLSDEAHLHATQARTDLEHLMDQMRGTNARLVAASAHARTMEHEARQREEAYRRLSGRLLQLQDEERRRVARDLHDSMAQRLAALTMNLDLIGATHVFGRRGRLALEESRSLVEQCSQEVRTLAYVLHPPLLDEAGLLSAVRWYVEGFTKRSGIDVDQELGDVGRLPRSIETALFRVVQESLSNVHRHASSAAASIHLTRAADAVALEVHDHGRGFRDELTHHDGTLRPGMLGVGISGMRERIAQLGGTFDVTSTDQGTTVRVRVPLNADTK